MIASQKRSPYKQNVGTKVIVLYALMKVVHDPAIDMANIQLFLPEAIFKPGKILIADAQGRLMEQLSVQYFNQQFTLNLGDWSVGTYSVSLISNEKIIQVSKLNVIK